MYDLQNITNKLTNDTSRKGLESEYYTYVII